MSVARTMIKRLALSLLVASAVMAQQPSVLPLHTLRPEIGLHGIGAQVSYGTSFCLSADCRYLLTNKHVVKALSLKNVEHTAVVSTHTSGEVDLGLIELRHPLTKYHGGKFRQSEVLLGESLTIQSYPKERALRRSVRTYQGTYAGLDQHGNMVIEADAVILGGASGGLVTDSKGLVVGILFGYDRAKPNRAMVVSAAEIEKFLQTLPILHDSLFTASKLSPTQPDYYDRYVPEHTSALGHHVPEPAEVQRLREVADELSQRMVNLIAQEDVAWSKGGQHQFADSFELQIADGFLRFKDSEGKMHDNYPWPPINTVLRPGDEWSDLPRMVSAERKLHVKQMPDKDGLHIFVWAASVEDQVCEFMEGGQLAPFTRATAQFNACWGEVWTTQEFQIVRATENDELQRTWKRYRSVMTYTNGLPEAIITTADFHGKTFRVDGTFYDYREFTSKVKIGTIQK